MQKSLTNVLEVYKFAIDWSSFDEFKKARLRSVIGSDHKWILNLATSSDLEMGNEEFLRAFRYRFGFRSLDILPDHCPLCSQKMSHSHPMVCKKTMKIVRGVPHDFVENALGFSLV